MPGSIAALVLALSAVVAGQEGGTPAQPSSRFTLTSSDVKGTFAQAQVLNGFGCSGGNISPQLSWTGAPGGTKSFALTMFDPDAPTGSGWWHWIVVNIPAGATQLPTGASGTPAKMPDGAQETRTDFGKPGYGGPCPPPGPSHRYVFTIYALKVPKLDLDAQATGAMVSATVRQNSLASATLTARFARK